MVALSVPVVVAAQDDDEKPTFPLDNFYAKRKKNAIRGILKDFHLSVSTGYGNTFLSHKLDGFGIFQPLNYQPRIFPVGPAGTPPFPRYSNWMNFVSGDTVSILPDSYLVSSDTAKLGFKGNGLNIPLSASLHYEFERYRVGLGYSYEITAIGKLHPISHRDKIKSFQPENAAGIMRKYYVMFGASFYRLGDYLFTGDAQLGGFDPGNNYSKGLIQKGVFANLGVTAERNFSEYLRAFARASFELKNYTIDIPGSGGKSIVHNMNAVYIQVGFSYSLPELPRCYNKNCNAQINHAHGNREYRSRMHKIWKWQNPIYGQNNPKLIKYKGRNKRKLNPY